MSLDVFRRRLVLDGVRLAGAGPAAPPVTIDRVAVRFRLLPVIRGHLYLDEVTVTAPAVRVVRELRERSTSRT